MNLIQNMHHKKMSLVLPALPFHQKLQLAKVVYVQYLSYKNQLLKLKLKVFFFRFFTAVLNLLVKSYLFLVKEVAREKYG